MRGATAIVFCLLLLVNSVAGCFHKGKKQASAPEDYFKKLAIEKAEKKIQTPDITLEEPSSKRIHLRDLGGKVVGSRQWYSAEGRAFFRGLLAEQP